MCMPTLNSYKNLPYTLWRDGGLCLWHLLVAIHLSLVHNVLCTYCKARWVSLNFTLGYTALMYSVFIAQTARLSLATKLIRTLDASESTNPNIYLLCTRLLVNNVCVTDFKLWIHESCPKILVFFCTVSSINGLCNAKDWC